MSCNSAVQSVMDSDVVGLPMVLSPNSSHREPAASDTHDKIGNIRDISPSDLRDVANNGYK